MIPATCTRWPTCGTAGCCYFTNRRNDVDFDPVIRDLTDGSERALQVGNHRFGEAALSPDGRWLALTVSSPGTANAEHVTLVDLSSPAGHEQLTAITPPDAPALNYGLGFTPGSDALYFTSNNDREFTAVARYELATAGSAGSSPTIASICPAGCLRTERRCWSSATTTEHPNWPCTTPPAAPGYLTCRCRRPAAWPRRSRPVIWAADSAAVALTFSSAELPSDVLLVPAAATGPASPSAASEPPIAGGPRLLTHSAAALRGERAARPEQHHVPGDDGQRMPCLVVPAAAGPDGPGARRVGRSGRPRRSRRPGPAGLQRLRPAAGGRRAHRAGAQRARLRPATASAGTQPTTGAAGWTRSPIWPRCTPTCRGSGSTRPRAALWGGSYGGYMVLAGLAFQPDLWAAGVDIVGIASLVTFLENTSAYRRAYREREYGTLARDREFLRSASPLTRIDDIVGAAVHHSRRQRPAGPAERGRADPRRADRAAAGSASCWCTATRGTAWPGGRTGWTRSRERARSWPAISPRPRRLTAERIGSVPGLVLRARRRC